MTRRGRRGGGTVQEISLPEFAEAMERFASEGLPEAASELHSRIHNEFKSLVVAGSPVGSVAKRRRGGMVGPGEYRASQRSRIKGTERTITPDVLLPMLGEASQVGSAAPHAQTLEKGRRTGRHRRRGSAAQRVMGSTQAPRGIYGPAARTLEQRQGAIIAEVIARAEEKL